MVRRIEREYYAMIGPWFDCLTFYFWLREGADDRTAQIITGACHAKA